MSTQFVREAVVGGDNPTTLLMDAIGKAAHRIEEIAGEMADAKEQDTARWNNLNEERARQAASLTELQAQFQKAKMEEETAAAVASVAEIKAQLASMRAPSKAGVIGGNRVRSQGYEAGTFIGSLLDLQGRDPDQYRAAKATLEAISTQSAALGKATLGSTDATGGWIIPNAIVDELIVPGAAANIYRQLMTVVPGVTTAAVDQPYRSARRTAAVIAAFGDTKENVNLTYGGYTATLYTLARIHDISAQFARQSRGAAERDVLAELSAAFAAGESYYIREGSGSSEPYGYTSALTNGPATFRSSFSPSATTLAGSIAAAVATAAGDLTGRGVTPTAVVMANAAYWTMLSQGTDTAGFFFAPAGGPNGIQPGTLQTPFGMPIYPDANATITGTGAVIDNLVVADWKKFKVYFGQAYRVDVSDMAGERFDKNLIGFRGEEEMGFDARPAVYAGHAQMITDIIP